MALGDIGAFLPAESQYGQPGSYEALLQGEATKRASYLSSMDMFYEELAEKTRQFDETLAFQRTSLETEVELSKWTTEQQGLLKSRELDIAEEGQERSLDLESRKTDVLERQYESEAAMAKEGLDLESRKLDILESQFKSTQEREVSEGTIWDWYTRQYESKTSPEAFSSSSSSTIDWDTESAWGDSDLSF